MGLPLFVAPVETDLPHKAIRKHGLLSPSRSAIRHLDRRPQSRDRRNATRRAAARVFDISQPNLPPTTQERQLPWPESDLELYPERPSSAEHSSGPLHEASRVMARADGRRGGRVEEQLNTIFGDIWHEISQGPSQREEQQQQQQQQEIDLGWWSVEPRPRVRRALVVAPPIYHYHLNPRQRRPFNIESPPLRPANNLPEWIGQAQSAPTTANNESQRPSSSTLDRPLRRRQVHLLRNLPSRRHSSRRALGLGADGLGDRDRSLSPEVWDTLLSTLTPDPQPPSAGSPFASAVALQGADPSSNAPPSAPDLADGTALDPACESGCENSDAEEPDYEHPHTDPIRRRREEPRHSSLQVPDYNLDGSSEGPFAYRAEPTGPQGVQAQADSWAGRLSGGISEDERGADRSRHSREDSAGIAPGAHTPDEEWLGMQRIVRSLAAREDIPDEWWAEAGLNRTLPQDGSS